MLLAEATPPPWQAWRAIERLALHGAPWRRAPEHITVTGGRAHSRLLALGDIAFTRLLGDDAHAVFAPVHAALERVELRTANLEAPLTARNVPAGSIGSFIRAEPARTALLRSAGFDVVNVAGNHALDYGTAGLADSLAALDAAGIGACGVAVEDTRSNLVVRPAGALRVGFLGFCDDYYAAAAGAAQPRPALATAAVIAASLANARPHVDFLVCHAHWGYEFTLHPMARHRALAHLMLDHGADLVLCHHAHVPHGIELRGPGVIAYGLGNAVMPLTPYMRAGHPWSQRVCALEVEFAARAVCALRVHCCALEPDGRQRSLDAAAQRGMRAGLARMSARLHDGAFLERLERCRLAFEGVALVDVLMDAGARDAVALQERALMLCLPRQRELIASLAQSFGQERLADALRALADAAQEPVAVAAVYARRRDALAAARPALVATYRWRDALRARIP
jgi:Bacterial capsule synthesis protein PGA_cap